MTDMNPEIATRPDLATALSKMGHGSKAQAVATLNDLLDLMRLTLRQCDGIALRDFGRFEVIETPERPGRNPKTGEPTVIPAGRRVKFKPSKNLLEDKA